MTNSISGLRHSNIPLWVSALAFVALLMLIATVFYPFGYDQAVFSVGGEMVMKGALPYRDFIDTKPPLIFYIYGAAIWLFGRHEWPVHLFDIIFQLASAYYFFCILRRALGAETALLAVSLTEILYSGSGFWMTVEAESFALLPSLVILDMTIRAIKNHPPAPSFLRRGRHAFYFGLIAGIAAFALVLLKFTLVFGALAAGVYVLLRRDVRVKTKLAYFSGVLSSAAVLVLARVYIMNSTGALQPFLQSLHWLSNYASISTTPLLELIFVIFPQKVVYSASAALIVLGLLGAISYIRSRSSNKRRNPLLELLAVTFIFQLIGVLAERKIEFPYQYTRALWAFAPFMAMGLILFVRFICRNWNSGKIGKKVLSVVSIALAVECSPLVRIFSQTVPWTVFAISSQDAGAEVERRIPDYFAGEQHAVASYISAHTGVNDKIFFWGNDVGIYFFADKLPQTICLTATPFRTDFTPDEWKNELLAQLSKAPPKYFIAEYGDARPYITGSMSDSYAALIDWNGLDGWLAANYSLDTTIGHFLIFRKK
jgi:hypothetical protein